MIKPKVFINEVPLEEGSNKMHLQCRIEAEGIDPIRIYFPTDATRDEISRALRTSAVYLVDDLPRSMRADIRQQIIELYEHAADEVPNFRERGR